MNARTIIRATLAFAIISATLWTANAAANAIDSFERVVQSRVEVTR